MKTHSEYGVVKLILPDRKLQTGETVRRFVADISCDSADRENLVQFQAFRNRHVIPEDLEPGDVVNITFCIRGCKFGPGREFFGSIINVVNIGFLIRAKDVKVEDDAVTRVMSEEDKRQEVEQLLNEIGKR